MDTTESTLEAGRRHLTAGRFHEAEILVRRVLAADASQAEAWYLLGIIAHAARQDDEAQRLIERAIELAPDCARYRNELGGIWRDRDNLEGAAGEFRAALAANPEYAIAHCNLGEIYKAYGKVPEALAAYRTALRYQPDFPACQGNLLMTLNYDPQIAADALLAEHLRWGRPQGALGPLPRAYDNRPDPHRALRIGYVSPDFRKHAVMRFFEPILAHHDRQQFEVVLYGEVPRDDEVTSRLRAMAAAYHRTVGRSAAELAAQIRAEGIDILVDLAGHTGHSRLDVFALKPAPVQVTYLGYCHTTGLPTIDYRVVDEVLEPPDAATRGTEELVRLAGPFFCFQPPAAAPPVAPPPVLTTGRITFGSHHGLPKLNERVLGLWRRLLDALPQSRLLVLRHNLAPGLVQELRGRLAQAGIPEARAEIRCTSDDEQQYLRNYADIDVVLDAFPFSGHTTTCEALWMGVPVVTLCGDRPSGRLSASVLSALGHAEWIARDSEQYVERALQLARDPGRLESLRRALRARVQERLCDGAAFTRRLEGAYRAMWESWLARREARPSLADAFREAQRHYEARRFHEAEKLLRAILADDPYHADARYLLGLLARAAGKARDAAALIGQALTLRPEWPEAHRELAIVLAQSGDVAGAEAEFHEALRLRPDYAAAWCDLGHARRQGGRADEAELAYLRAIAVDPAQADYQLALAHLLQALGREGEAQVHRQHAARLNPAAAIPPTRL